jgi:hypothetical protein
MSHGFLFPAVTRRRQQSARPEPGNPELVERIRLRQILLLTVPVLLLLLLLLQLLRRLPPVRQGVAQHVPQPRRFPAGLLERPPAPTLRVAVRTRFVVVDCPRVGVATVSVPVPAVAVDPPQRFGIAHFRKARGACIATAIANASPRGRRRRNHRRRRGRGQGMFQSSEGGRWGVCRRGSRGRGGRRPETVPVLLDFPMLLVVQFWKKPKRYPKQGAD